MVVRLGWAVFCDLALGEVTFVLFAHFFESRNAEC